MPGQWHRIALCLTLSCLLAACASLPKEAAPSRHTDFLARLIVVDTDNRWQAMLDWHASESERGWMRITHAATSRVVELRWQGAAVWQRDNQAPSPAWRHLKPGELAEHGIPLQPRELAAFLLGKRPRDFTATGEGHWKGKRGKSRIQVQWRGNRLSIDDLTLGRKAVLNIIRDTGTPSGD